MGKTLYQKETREQIVERFTGNAAGDYTAAWMAFCKASAKRFGIPESTTVDDMVQDAIVSLIADGLDIVRTNPEDVDAFNLVRNALMPIRAMARAHSLNERATEDTRILAMAETTMQAHVIHALDADDLASRRLPTRLRTLLINAHTALVAAQNASPRPGGIRLSGVARTMTVRERCDIPMSRWPAAVERALRILESKRESVVDDLAARGVSVADRDSNAAIAPHTVRDDSIARMIARNELPDGGEVVLRALPLWEQLVASGATEPDRVRWQARGRRAAMGARGRRGPLSGLAAEGTASGRSPEIRPGRVDRLARDSAARPVPEVDEVLAAIAARSHALHRLLESAPSPYSAESVRAEHDALYERTRAAHAVLVEAAKAAKAARLTD